LSGPSRVLVSACLLGVRCRYDGAHKRYDGVEQAIAGCEAVPVCPEVAGGLPIPRSASGLVGGDGAAVLAGRARVLSDGGEERTAAFLAGARACLAHAPDAAWALLKEGSPSCGVNLTWVDGRKVPGKGVFAALLTAAGIPLRTEETTASSTSSGRDPSRPPSASPPR
jgi:uncharacterized protein YbbK (DUF523 family)